MVRKITKDKIVGLYVNDYAGRYYLREMAFLLGKSHQTIKPYVEELVRENVLVKNRRRNVVEYFLNFKDRKVFDYLIISEKTRLMERLNEDAVLSLLYDKLSGYFEKSVFVIFGSSVNKIKNGSDIDLLIISKGDISRISKEIKNFEEIYNKKVHRIHIGRIEKLTLSLIKEIYKKHLILNDTESVVRFFGGLYEKNKLV